MSVDVFKAGDPAKRAENRRQNITIGPIFPFLRHSVRTERMKHQENTQDEEATFFSVTEPFHGLELEEFLSLKILGYSKFYLRSLLHSGKVSIDDKEIRGGTVSVGTEIQVLFPAKKPETYFPSPLDFEVLYEDSNLIVLEKPSGVPSVAEQFRSATNLMNGLLHYFGVRQSDSPNELPIRPRMIHRLDKDTSGVMVVAKTRLAEKELSIQFRDRSVTKKYYAWVIGDMILDEDVIDKKLVPHPTREKMITTDRARGKPSQTQIKVVRRYRGYTLVEATPLTGRTHQIRVHLSSYGHPLIVDPLYGGKEAIYLSEIKPRYRPKKGKEEPPVVSRLTLHSHSLTIKCPETGEPIHRESSIPKDQVRLEGYLEKHRAVRRPHGG